MLLRTRYHSERSEESALRWALGCASRLGYLPADRAPHLYAAFMIILTADVVIAYYVYQHLRRTKKS